jgi:hypothetical protein
MWVLGTHTAWAGGIGEPTVTKHAAYILGVLVLVAAGCALDATAGEGAESSHWEASGGSEAAPQCDVSCNTSADCSASEPYCNYSLGACQAAPPMCATDADCEVEGDRCWSDGYCWFYPELNCAPGETVFEGQCDNPSCVPERCPEGTAFDEETCACNPTGVAPACESQSDCSPAYPYCDRDTGSCRTTPAECVGDTDCDEAAPFCSRTGYCADAPEPNCAPGEIAIDGECEISACESMDCPAGAFLDEETCACIPTCESA